MEPEDRMTVDTSTALETNDDALDAEELAAERAMAAGFSRVAADEAAADADRATPNAQDDAVETTQTESEAVDVSAGAAAPAADPAPDPWANVDPIVRKSIEELTGKASKIDQLEHGLRSTQGRVNAIHKAQEAAKATANAGGDAPTQGQIAAAANAGGEKWKQLKEDFPVWADAFEERLAALPNNGPQLNVDDVIATVTEKLGGTLNEIQETAVTLAVVEIAHPKWRKTINTPEFQAWRAQQPADVQALGASDDPQDAIDMLDRYAESRGTPAQPPAARSTSRLTRAVQPKGDTGTRGQPPVIDDDAAFKRGFNKVASKG